MERKGTIVGEERVSHAIQNLNYFVGNDYQVEGKELGDKIQLYVNGRQVPFVLNSYMNEIEEVDKKDENMLISVLGGELKRYVHNSSIEPKKKVKTNLRSK